MAKKFKSELKNPIALNKEDNIEIVIGIDAGTTTGLAIYSTKVKRIINIDSFKIHRALRIVYELSKEYSGKIFVVVEDARKRKWYGKQSGTHALQGVGSIKRDCTIWNDFLEDYAIPYKMSHPIKGGTKISAEKFIQITGYKGKTNEHSRDAGMLVWSFFN